MVRIFRLLLDVGQKSDKVKKLRSILGDREKVRRGRKEKLKKRKKKEKRKKEKERGKTPTYSRTLVAQFFTTI